MSTNIQILYLFIIHHGYVSMYVCVMYVCLYVCLYVRLYACLYVCMYVCLHVYLYVPVCMYICMYVMLFLLDTLYLTYQTFRGSTMTPRPGRLSLIFFKIHPPVPFSMNNQITLCSYYVQLSTILCEQLHTIVDDFMHLFFDCPELRNTRASHRYMLL